jgi:hypothetical protein
VYNEHVRDLLAPRTTPPMYLKIRESQTDGVYVQGLNEVEVKSFADVRRLMDVGDSVCWGLLLTLYAWSNVGIDANNSAY